MQDPQKISNTKNEPKLWPSERIPQGGLFHAPKFEYSKETADLLKCKCLTNFIYICTYVFICLS